MPRRTPRACAHPGCPNLVRDGQYCPVHAAQHKQKVYRQRKNDGTLAQYGSAWRKLSAKLLKENPVCEICGKKPSQLIHHIEPRRFGGTDEESNLIAVCRECHERLHANDKLHHSRKYTY